MDWIAPPPLSPGDRIAVVAPARPAAKARLERGCDRLREVFDLEPVVFPTADRGGDTPAPPAERAADLHAAFEDPSIRGVIAYTGGDDQLRVLPHLDPERLRASPTRFFGYSDNDNVRHFLWTHGLVSYGGQLHPDLITGSTIHPATERYYRRAFFDPSLGALAPVEEWTDRWFDFETERPREWFDADGWTWRTGGDGRAVSGRTWGGCVSILDWQLQTDRYLPDPARLDGAILVLETSETVPYEADVGYLLRSLGERGWLQRFDGVLVARPRAHSPHSDRNVSFESYRRTLREAVCEQLDAYNSTAVAAFDVDFGHTEPRIPLPLGAVVRLDARTERIEFPEPEAD
ncbi:S66 family peptidase [Haloferacaceae archaeon DSL9]